MRRKGSDRVARRTRRKRKRDRAKKKGVGSEQREKQKGVTGKRREKGELSRASLFPEERKRESEIDDGERGNVREKINEENKRDEGG